MAQRQKTREIAEYEGGDARIEEVLDKRGVQYKFHPGVSGDDFDRERSMNNQVRFKAVDLTKVDEYSEAMKRGDIFPPVIAEKGRHGFINADGNHRLQAALKARKPLRVYELVNARPETVALIASEINARHGLPTTEDERVQQALHLLEQGATLATAADAANVSRKLLEQSKRKRDTDVRFLELGISPLVIEKLGETVKWRLSGISTNAGFRAAVELADVADLSSDQAFKLVKDVNEFKDSDEQVAYIKDVRADMMGQIAEVGGGVFVSQVKRVLGPRARLGSALTNVLALPDDVELLAKTYVGAEREDVAKRLTDAAKRMNALARALKA